MVALLLSVGATWADSFEDGAAADRRGDYATALRIYQSLAAQGDTKAEFSLGFMYARGEGVTQNYAEAVKWFRLAAEQGNAYAQFTLGFLFDDGQRVAQDYAEAVKWYRLAAAQGNAEAQSNLGRMYALGRGITRDYAEAVKWFRLAAEQGNAKAQSSLGSMYALGQGVAQDYVQAYMWFNLGVASGDVDGVKKRDMAAAEMTPQQITEAQRMTRECQQHNFKGCEVAQSQNQAPKQGSCEQTVEMHGFLSRGQFQCEFRYYAESMLEAAHECTSHMQEAEVRHWLDRGMRLYDFNESKRGHAAMCASLLADFPQILRK